MNIYKKVPGVSLIELVISLSIFSFIALVGSTVLFNFGALELRNRNINATETDLENLVNTLQSLASQAVGVRSFTGSLDGYRSPVNGAGYVRTFSYTRDTDMGVKDSTTLMFFGREVGASQLNAANQTSTFRPTGVFFEKKDEVNNSSRRAGRISIDLGAANANGIVTPENADLVFNNISDVIIDEPQITTGNLLTGVRVTIVVIYSTLTTKEGLDCFGPTADIIAGRTCSTNATRPFKTIRRSFYLNFANNKRPTKIDSSEFSDGVYLFKPILGQ